MLNPLGLGLNVHPLLALMMVYDLDTDQAVELYSSANGAPCVGPGNPPSLSRSDTICFVDEINR